MILQVFCWNDWPLPATCILATVNASKICLLFKVGKLQREEKTTDYSQDQCQIICQLTYLDQGLMKRLTGRDKAGISNMKQLVVINWLALSPEFHLHVRVILHLKWWACSYTLKYVTISHLWSKHTWDTYILYVIIPWKWHLNKSCQTL